MRATNRLQRALFLQPSEIALRVAGPGRRLVVGGRTIGGGGGGAAGTRTGRPQARQGTVCTTSLAADESRRPQSGQGKRTLSSATVTSEVYPRGPPWRPRPVQLECLKSVLNEA